MICVALVYIPHSPYRNSSMSPVLGELSCTISIILSYFVLRLSEFTPSASIFTLNIFILSSKSSTSLFAQPKLGSSFFLLTWLFLIVFVKLCTVPTTWQFVPQYFACFVDRSLQIKNIPERYLSATCEHGLNHLMYLSKEIKRWDQVNLMVYGPARLYFKQKQKNNITKFWLTGFF